MSDVNNDDEVQCPNNGHVGGFGNQTDQGMKTDFHETRAIIGSFMESLSHAPTSPFHDAASNERTACQTDTGHGDDSTAEDIGHRNNMPLRDLQRLAQENLDCFKRGEPTKHKLVPAMFLAQRCTHPTGEMDPTLASTLDEMNLTHWYLLPSEQPSRSEQATGPTAVTDGDVAVPDDVSSETCGMTGETSEFIGDLYAQVGQLRSEMDDESCVTGLVRGSLLNAAIQQVLARVEPPEAIVTKLEADVKALTTELLTSQSKTRDLQHKLLAAQVEIKDLRNKLLASQIEADDRENKFKDSIKDSINKLFVAQAQRIDREVTSQVHVLNNRLSSFKDEVNSRHQDMFAESTAIADRVTHLENASKPQTNLFTAPRAEPRQQTTSSAALTAFSTNPEVTSEDNPKPLTTQSEAGGPQPRHTAYPSDPLQFPVSVSGTAVMPPLVMSPTTSTSETVCQAAAEFNHRQETAAVTTAQPATPVKLTGNALTAPPSLPHNNNQVESTGSMTGGAESVAPRKRSFNMVLPAWTIPGPPTAQRKRRRNSE